MFILGKMDESMMGYGTMENNMVLESTTYKMAHLNRGSGIKGKESNGSKMKPMQNLRVISFKMLLDFNFKFFILVEFV